MAHDDKTRREARKSYVYQRQSLPTIGITLTVPEGTLRRWKREAKETGDDWDVARAANTISGEGLEVLVSSVIEDFVVLYQTCIESVKHDGGMEAPERVKLMAMLADAFNKTVGAAGRVSPKISELGVAMDVLKRLSAFVQQHHPHRSDALLEVLEPFGTHLSEVYCA